jgi:autotransporter-associated beta strand protein
LTNTGGVAVSNGTLTLTNANTYTGGTTLSSNGVLQVGNAGALGAASATLTLNGGTLASDSTTARTITAAGASTIGGNITFGDATNTGALTLSNAFNLGGATRTLTTASDVTLSGAISNGGLIKLGSGILTLSVANSSLAGGTTVNEGTLITGNANALGANGSAVTLGSGSTNATLLLGFNMTHNYAVTVSSLGSGTVLFGGASGLSALNTQFDGTLTLGRSVTLRGGSVDRFTMSGKITGTGDITIATPLNAGGRVSWNQSTLAVANDFVGNITIQNNAQLQIGVGSNTNNYAIPDAANIYFDAQTGSIVNLRLSGSGTGATESVNALISNAVGAGWVAYADGTSGTLTIGAGNGSGTFSGLISGALSIVKSGSGNQVLSGTNTF